MAGIVKYFFSAPLFAVLTAVSVCPIFSDNLSAKLVITGPGTQIYTYWGHIGIVIRNNDTGKDTFYDFGNFSFDSKNFYRDFMKGYMPYLALGSSADAYISFTLSEDRTLTTYKLNLGNEELEELDALLRWWVLPENRVYLYNYFDKNCSTIIRDILNQVTDAQLEAYTKPVPERTYRHYARIGAYLSLPTEVLLHYLIGPRTDRPISGWEKMFIPSAVADFATSLEYTGRDGIKRTLLGEKTVLQTSSRPPVPDETRILWPYMLAFGILLAAMWCIQGKFGMLMKALIVIFIGIPGSFVGYVHLFTNHQYGYWNINLWPSFPTILLALIPIFAVKMKNREKILAWLWTINLAGLLIAVFLRLSGLIVQDAGAFWAFFTPLTFSASYPGLLLRIKLQNKLRRPANPTSQDQY
ncbi:MAG: hypothetical protein B0D92_07325 [Spirochaeta sp. LUC14_002_19_P3]|nr:MAG: hypothetical protein B0D92_07325 [Spirochaeta sp. LUC14_002_19_P3]